jgi:hypothetical protein
MIAIRAGLPDELGPAPVQMQDSWVDILESRHPQIQHYCDLLMCWNALIENYSQYRTFDLS